MEGNIIEKCHYLVSVKNENISLQPLDNWKHQTHKTHDYQKALSRLLGLGKHYPARATVSITHERAISSGVVLNVTIKCQF